MRLDDMMWDLFDRYPLIPIILFSSALFFLQIPGIYQYLQVHEYLPNAPLEEVEILRLYEEKYYRSFSDNPYCYADFYLDGRKQKAKLSCEEFYFLKPGNHIQVIKSMYLWVSLDVAKEDWTDFLVLIIDLLFLAVYIDIYREKSKKKISTL